MEEITRKPVAVIECWEEIPCNPCVHACPHKAIHMEEGMHHIPWVDENVCTGCTICVAKCSGQAIFVVERTDETAKVSFPYEMLPLPERGMAVYGTDRDGNIVCDGTIANVNLSKAFDHTAVVTIEIPGGLEKDVRGFRYKEEA